VNRPHHPALVCEGPGEWSVAEWAHARDRKRVLVQDWPFGDGPGHWGPPAPQCHLARRTDKPHPRSTQARRAARNDHYAAQAALYARGVHPDLVLTDDIAPEDESSGTELHQLMERFMREEES
jgi:hypothetical protein